jgi:serine protease AprX
VAGAAPAGAGTSVGVIDGEVAGNHPALAGRIVHRRNFTREGWGNPSPHATAIAGIIAADDATDSGVAPGVTITNYKVLAPGTTQQDFDGYLAIQEALNDDMDVVNCSWGVGPSGDGTSRMAVLVDNAWALGMVVVKSAGNLGPQAGTITSPGDAQGVIVVGATDADGLAVTDYSSRGPVAGRPGPHLVAPGGTSANPLRVAQVGGGFAQAPTAWGTSFAAPHVTGAAALLRAQDRALRPDDVRNGLVGDCHLLPAGGADAQGAGLIRLR